ncbi:dihydrofolate reductase [Aeromonas phage AsFcp_4]|uniref:dihydrofolate reductase n=1 Tax=Aeromonas phage PX29 TaxID=926067 RepID=E5DQN8_9CAUD|nr:dihydrofolate reductase [Aeromonas phage PX29]ADQ53024.1 Frd dihydrofolate reductase [Aeromonas phage PX29]QAX98559.1 dihydrofolate reductase [Aeromonas phage AsFcp_2]QAX99590.1 dihydrofolate reductase [Aeromonas phage AsFcp_4]
MIKAVFATGSFGEFGNKGELPWGHCRVDMLNFMKETSDFCLVMGAKTFMSLPSKLKNRTNIVLSTSNETSRVLAKNGDRPDMFYHGSVSQALSELQTTYDKICVIGGMKVLTEAIDMCDEVVHTVILNETKLDYDVALDVELEASLTRDFWVLSNTFLGNDEAIAYTLKRNKK